MHARKHHLLLGIIIVVVSTINVFIFSEAKQRTNVHANTEQQTVVALASTTRAEGGNASSTAATTTTDLPADTKIIHRLTQKGDFAPFTLIHFGDAMFDRGVRDKIASGTDLFDNLRNMDIMNDYNVRMLNLEGPITALSAEECQQKPLSFQFATTTARMLSLAGFNVASLANNHAYDCNQAGIDSTNSYLRKSGIIPMGNTDLSRSWIETTSASGTSIAMIGLDTTLGATDLSGVPSLITKLKATHDLVLISVHWGDEYALRANDTQKALAHAWIDAGADVIIGNHPHVVENVESYKGHAIFYALGNFVFDQVGEKQNEGIGVGMTLYSGSAEFMLYPYKIIHAVPTFLSPLDANKWCTKYLGVMPNISPYGCAFSLTTTQ